MAGAGRKTIAVQFGEGLRRLRMRRGLTQEDVAYDAGLHRTEIGLLERGERVPGIETVFKLASALSISPNELLEGITWERSVPKKGQTTLARRGKRRDGRH
jgi:transcriptional regulator with XRE-family HTH domain